LGKDVHETISAKQGTCMMKVKAKLKSITKAVVVVVVVVVFECTVKGFQIVSAFLYDLNGKNKTFSLNGKKMKHP